MSIKIQCRVGLPYIIRLKDAKDYEREFNFSEFSFFKMTLLFNDAEYESIYSENYDKKSCQFMQIEAISDKYHYQNYKVNKIMKKLVGETTFQEYEHDVEDVPEEVEMDIMKDISPRINEIIDYIKEKSGMFWLSPISINPTSDMLGIFTDYFFYAPNAKIDREMRKTITTIDNYMEAGSGVSANKIYDKFFDDYEDFEKDKYRISHQFLEKAKTALYESKINEAIIYGAIAQESFISKYIEDNAPESDIIYKKLHGINGHLMDLKYNVILKYLKNKSLKEINQSYWNTIQNLYKLRNALMHSGEITPEFLEKNGFASLNFNEIKKALKNVENAFKEIKKL